MCKILLLQFLAVVIDTTPSSGIVKDFTSAPDEWDFEVTISNNGYVPILCSISGASAGLTGKILSCSSD